MRTDALTPREHQLWALISKGYPARKIATELGISEYTVEDHTKRIFSKLGVHNRTQAALKFYELEIETKKVLT